ncbi:MAG: CotH kinase family protein, partial [Clostridia bacterium]
MKQLNKKRVVFVLGLMFALVMSIAACSPAPQETENEAPKPNPNVMEDKDINSLTIQDNDAIYKDDDDLSVVTMYLTVSQGNAMDNTNHLWSDVNSHSVFYYGDLGIERMRAEGMLQVGDEKGPKAGEFGYGAVSPNATVQIRGKTSSRSPQKSYKVELKKNKGKWRLQSTIPLNKHVYDSVRFRNKLSYDLMKTIPNIMSARTQCVH